MFGIFNLGDYYNSNLGAEDLIDALKNELSKRNNIVLLDKDDEVIGIITSADALNEMMVEYIAKDEGI